MLAIFLFLSALFSEGQAQKNDAVDSAYTDRIFEKVDIEATFPGGEVIWRKYLEKNLNANIPVENGAPIGTFTVIVQFIVDKEGNISDVKALTNHGYGMEEEVLKIIKKGPKWIPANQNGRIVKAYRKQPVTFVVMADGFDISIKDDFVLHVGIDNSVTIKVDKMKNDNLVVNITQGTITYVDGNDYLVRVSTPGRVIIRVYNKKRGMKEIGAAIFDAKDQSKSSRNTKSKIQEK
jgi:TonB family protein